MSDPSWIDTEPAETPDMGPSAALDTLPDPDYLDWLMVCDAENIAPAFCASDEIHAPHTYTGLNRNTYRCTGWDADDQDAQDECDARPPCEHGLSAWLCAGPGHYPPD